MSYELPDWMLQLIVGTVVSIASFVGGTFLGHKLSLKAQRQQVMSQYLVANVGKTYVPILQEIQRIVDNYQGFFGEHFSFGHYTIATTDDPNKYTFSKIRKEGYFDMILLYNKKLAERIIHFYDDVLPVLRQTEEVNREVDRAIINEWQNLVNQKYAYLMKGMTLSSFGEQLLQYNKQVLYNGSDRWGNKRSL